MEKSYSLGEFEKLVLLAVLRLREQAYGMRIRREIEERTAKNISIGAVYITLDRLAAKGLVSSKIADPTPERSGRAKRFWTIEAAGQTAIEESQRALNAMLNGLGLPEAI